MRSCCFSCTLVSECLTILVALTMTAHMASGTFQIPVTMRQTSRYVGTRYIGRQSFLNYMCSGALRTTVLVRPLLKSKTQTFRALRLSSDVDVVFFRPRVLYLVPWDQHWPCPGDVQPQTDLVVLTAGSPQLCSELFQLCHF